MVNVPLRSLVPLLAVTRTLTDPLPVPAAPLSIVIHARSDAAVQAHWLAVVTVTDSDPPDAPNVRDETESA
jgi:hypothetical protein